MNVYVVFGVSGSGKSTVGRILADTLGIPHYDADDFHPKSNKDKMASGQPLNDKDRDPWLRTLALEMGDWSQKEGAVLSCSALKEKYRKILESHCDEIHWVLLHGTRELLADRLAQRKSHFFNPKLLDSQLIDLEIPIYGCHVDIAKAPEEIITTIKNHF